MAERILSIVLLLIGLAVAIYAAIRLMSSGGMHAAPRGDAPEPVDVPGPEVVPYKPVDGHPPWTPEPVHRFSPAEWKQAAEDVNELVKDVKARFGLNEAPPARPAHATDAQTTGEIFEHLHEGPDCWCLPWKPPPPPGLPEQIRGELNDHHTVDGFLDSLCMHAEEAHAFRAELGKALENGEVPHA